MTESRAFLLASNDRHPLIESNIGHRVRRCTDPDTCVQMILTEMETCKRIDLFLSSENSNIIRNKLPLFKNIYFHLYCPTVDDITNYEGLYPYPAYVQVFEEDNLWVNISYVILGHDLTHLAANYSTDALERYEATHGIILEEVEAAKLGVQPDE